MAQAKSAFRQIFGKLIEKHRDGLWKYLTWIKGQVTIKINKDLLTKSPIEDWFPLSSRPNKKDSVQGSLQLKIQYGDGKEEGTNNNNATTTVVQEKQNLKVSANWNTKGR